MRCRIDDSSTAIGPVAGRWDQVDMKSMGSRPIARAHAGRLPGIDTRFTVIHRQPRDPGQEKVMSRRSFIVRRALGCGVALGLLIGLYAVSSAAASPPASMAEMAARGPAGARPTPLPPPPSPTPVPGPIIQIVVCEWCGVGFSPGVANVYPVDHYSFVLDNVSGVDVGIADPSGAPVNVAAGTSVLLRVSGPGTYQYVVSSPRSAKPATLTIVAHLS
jgi:hypothetical protein